MAGKRKREESPPCSPRRRSARISDMQSSASGTTAPLGSVRSLRSREMSALTGVSELSTEEESPVRFNSLDRLCQVCGLIKLPDVTIYMI
jgi:hypothetical protein